MEFYFIIFIALHSGGSDAYLMAFDLTAPSGFVVQVGGEDVWAQDTGVWSR